MIRTLWPGGEVAPRRGATYTVEHARVYDASRRAPADLVSGFGPKAIKPRRSHRGRVLHHDAGPGVDRDVYRTEGGTRKPVHAGIKVCLCRRADEARRHRPPAVGQRGVPGELSQVLPTPAHFEQACELVEPEMLVTPVGPDLGTHLASLRQYADAGVDELFVQQIGPEQDAFFDRWAAEILPEFAGAATR